MSPMFFTEKHGIDTQSESLTNEAALAFASKLEAGQ